MELLQDLQIISNLNESEINSTVADLNSQSQWKIYLLSQSKEPKILSILRLIKVIEPRVLKSGDIKEELKKFKTYILDYSDQDELSKKGYKIFENAVLGLEDYFIFEKMRVASESVNSIQSLKIYNDIRPVFNLKRNTIAKYIYPVRMEFSMANNVSFTAELLDNEVDDLIETLKKSKKQINIMIQKHES